MVALPGCSNHKESFLEKVSQIEAERLKIESGHGYFSNEYKLEALKSLKEKTEVLKPDWQQGKDIKGEIVWAINHQINTIEKPFVASSDDANSLQLKSSLDKINRDLLTNSTNRIRDMIKEERALLR